MAVVHLAELVSYLDSYLNISGFADSPGAVNGLQVENRGRVSRIAVAVDACQAVIERAASGQADLLVVHHGLFWGGGRPVVGRTYSKLAALIRADLALYSAHLPLDAHPTVGNNAELARLVGLSVDGWWGEVEGRAIGVHCAVSLTREELVGRVGEALQCAPRMLAFGPAQCRKVGIVTGSGGSMIAAAAAAGIDTFITGEGQHWTYFEAEELGLNVVFAGHYATETLGVKALAAHIEGRFQVPWFFLDHPTGM